MCLFVDDMSLCLENPGVPAVVREDRWCLCRAKAAGSIPSLMQVLKEQDLLIRYIKEMILIGIWLEQLGQRKEEVYSKKWILLNIGKQEEEML